MPIYEYKCLSCGYEFELIHIVGIGKVVPCPKCNDVALKQMSAPSIAKLATPFF